MGRVRGHNSLIWGKDTPIITIFLKKTIREYWSKRQVETNGSFQNHSNSWDSLYGVIANRSISYLNHAQFQILHNYILVIEEALFCQVKKLEKLKVICFTSVRYMT